MPTGAEMQPDQTGEVPQLASTAALVIEGLESFERQESSVEPFLKNVVKVENLQSGGAEGDLDSTVYRTELLTELLGFEHADEVTARAQPNEFSFYQVQN